jgi:hypothetical protein
MRQNKRAAVRRNSGRNVFFFINGRDIAGRKQYYRQRQNGKEETG